MRRSFPRLPRAFRFQPIRNRFRAARDRSETESIGTFFAGKLYSSLDSRVPHVERMESTRRGVLTNFYVKQNAPLTDRPNHTSAVLVRHGDGDNARFVMVSAKDPYDEQTQLSRHTLVNGHEELDSLDVVTIPMSDEDHDSIVVYEVDGRLLSDEVRENAWTLDEFLDASDDVSFAIALGFLETDPRSSGAESLLRRSEPDIERAPRATRGRYSVDESGRGRLEPQDYDARRYWGGQPGGAVISFGWEVDRGHCGLRPVSAPPRV